MKRENPELLHWALELTGAADKICGLIEMMCNISHPNELCFITGHIVINQKKKKKYIHVATQCNLCPNREGFPSHLFTYVIHPLISFESTMIEMPGVKNIVFCSFRPPPHTHTVL